MCFSRYNDIFSDALIKICFRRYDSNDCNTLNGDSYINKCSKENNQVVSEKIEGVYVSKLLCSKDMLFAFATTKYGKEMNSYIYIYDAEELSFDEKIDITNYGGSVELQKEIDKLHQMKSKAEAKKFQLYDDYTKGIVQRDIMVSERTTLTERIGEIEIELHELESKIQLEQCINKAGEEETIELLSKMETFDLDLIRQVVKRITMYDDGNIQFEWNVDDFLQVK